MTESQAPLDPRIAAALALHKPVENEHVSLASIPGHWRLARACTCADWDDYPCATAVALGVPGEPGSATTLTEALTWWWMAHGLDEEAAAVAAALEAVA